MQKTVEMKDLTLINITNNVIAIKNMVTVESVQEYFNNEEEAVNINYRFPIPSAAAVYTFELIINDEVFAAKITSKEDAIKQFNDAAKEGNTASILQKTNEIFSFLINNIPAKTGFKIKIKYIYEAVITDEKCLLSIPTTLAPKYGDIEGQMLECLPHQIAKCGIDFNVKLYNCCNIEAASDHDIEIHNKEEYYEIIAKEVIPNRNFSIKYEIPKEICKIVTKKDDKTYSYLNINLPDPEEQERISDLKYMFIMDKSGSMMGSKLDSAKNTLKLCIRNLEDTDKFNVMFFNNDIIKFKENYISTNDSFDEIDYFIDNMKATGGTNIYAALKDCIYEDNLTIFLFTDGQVYNEEEIYDLIKNKGKNTRVFCFGIDSAIDEHFISKMAKLGDGKCHFIKNYSHGFVEAINMMISSFYKPYKVHIKTSKEELLENIYPENNYSLIKDHDILSVEIYEKENFNIKEIIDDNLFETLKIIYYNDLLNNKKLDYELLLKYSKESNILTNNTSFILVKQNEEKVFAHTAINITGMMPGDWAVPYGSTFSVRDNTSAVKGRCLIAPDELFLNSCSVRSVSSCSTQKEQKSFSLYTRSAPTQIYKEKQNKEIHMFNEIEEKEKQRMFMLFLKQQKDGSIDGSLELTLEVVKLYEKYDKPKQYKIQYKKALKYIKKNK